jgi:DNA-binding response OmpR family regulator
VSLRDAHFICRRRREGLPICDPGLTLSDFVHGMFRNGKTNSKVPVLIFTSRETYLTETGRHFDSGADENLIEPLPVSELLSSKKTMRRSSPVTARVICRGVGLKLRGRFGGHAST